MNRVAAVRMEKERAMYFEIQILSGTGHTKLTKEDESVRGLISALDNIAWNASARSGNFNLEFDHNPNRGMGSMAVKVTCYGLSNTPEHLEENILAGMCRGHSLANAVLVIQQPSATVCVRQC